MTVTTVDGFMQLNPGERLKFAEALGTNVTPEIVALLMHTCLREHMDLAVRKVYFERLRALIAKVNGLKLFLLAYRYINARKAPRETLWFHQELSTILRGMTNGLTWAYIRARTVNKRPQYFVGSLNRRISPSNLASLTGLTRGDGVLYNEGDVQWEGGHYHRGTVAMLLVPINDALPSTLGLATAA